MLERIKQKKKVLTRTPKFGVTTKGGGFTLLELLIYVSILSILVIVVSAIFVSLSKGNGQSQAKSEVNNAIRFATELIRQDLKNAGTVSVPSTITPTSSSLTLVRDGVTIIYDVSLGVLRRKEGTALPSNITNPNVFVDTPTFTRIENTNTIFNITNVSIKVNMNFGYNSTSPDWEYSTSLQTSVSLY